MLMELILSCRLHFVYLDYDSSSKEASRERRVHTNPLYIEREALDLYPQERGALKSPGEPSVDLPLSSIVVKALRHLLFARYGCGLQNEQ